MPADETQPEGQDELSDELARKYDPERLLKMFGKRAGSQEQLDATVRSKYERRLGVDLGHVRVITGEFAEEFNRKREAYAVTVGGTGMILMGNSPDKAMGTTAGQALLAHELTHVAQAQRGLHRKATYTGDMPFGEDHDEIEAEAEAEEHAEGQGATQQSAAENIGQMISDDQLKADIEKIKARVMQLAADAVRTQLNRNGSSRRA